MIDRRLSAELKETLESFPAVALLGPRQVGKTTLALSVTTGRPQVYLDLESPADRAKLSDAEAYLGSRTDALVIIDEVQRLPGLFATLRGIIDRARRRGRKSGQFLLLGSASQDLLRQSSESLAGRIAYLELAPFDLIEVPPTASAELFLRGGFPESFLARSDKESLRWRQSFVRTYLERDIPQLGPRIAAETLRRFWTMLAHAQGGLLNAASLARGLDVDGKTVGKYLDLLVDLMLVRRLTPLHVNVGKRLTKAPKIYVRDSGLTHALLGIASEDAVLSHPVIGASWEGFVVENLIGSAPPATSASFYRTAAGAEVDLILDLPSTERIAVEIKRGSSPALTKGNHLGFVDVAPRRRFVVYGGNERYPLGNGVEAMGLRDLMVELGTSR